jgi:hypothetical protein
MGMMLHKGTGLSDKLPSVDLLLSMMLDSDKGNKSLHPIIRTTWVK